MYEGIRFYGGGGDIVGEIILHEIWDEDPKGQWSEIQKIPNGHMIVGLRANTANKVSGVLYSLELVTGLRPSYI